MTRRADQLTHTLGPAGQPVAEENSPIAKPPQDLLI